MPAPLLTRTQVVERLIPVFRRGGYEGASLAELSRATGLGRSSLYHYFPGGKEDMALAALEYLGTWVREHIALPLRGEGTATERLQRMLDKLQELYSGGRELCLLGAMVIGARHRFQPQLSTAFNGMITALAQLLVEAGLEESIAQERAESAILQIQGALILAAGLDDPAPFTRLLQRLSRDLLADTSERRAQKFV